MKFADIMNGGSQVKKQLEGLNNRYENGLGLGAEQFY